MENRLILRIATWNLDHASNSDRPTQAQIEKILQINPDIIVLTETSQVVSLASHGYEVAYPEKKNGYGKYDAAIWSRYPIVKTFKTIDPELSVCAQINCPSGGMLVYATIIPYHGYKGVAKTSGAWEEHYKSIAQLGDDCAKLLKISSDNIPLLIAGDFNQTRDNSRGTYGTIEGRLLLSNMLDRNDLVCLTNVDFGKLGLLRPDPKKGWARNNVDHICLTKEALPVIGVGAWDHFTEDGVYLSDHNGVYVDLQAK